MVLASQAVSLSPLQEVHDEKVLCGGAIAVAAIFFLSQPAGAVLGAGKRTFFNQYGYTTTLKAYEGGRLVAEGRGWHGIDTVADRWGKQVGSRDPRPGGSPVRGKLNLHVYCDPIAGCSDRKIEGSQNFSSTWVDEARWKDLGVTPTRRGYTYGEVCQDDAWPAPDDCGYTANGPDQNW
ncbi:hypothetical protein GCM10009810_02950 [Nostocoides vanveenii]|uniref:Uncharacterized protein n=1 Tax=Nostocoides vanveenii TaxID=330835 RepID=A0ABN2K0T0_9MICO